ncbi:uncharacterized protein F5147DRAFT_705617 [Suillus discolor]|uniref:Uncharacterized protein n=1 Tax=Suillus discolor TaxID=1912936 RepID=A0A9P7F3F1_9AGAM|nr:uncharacterized protein F5147DRAFT_705617 [Suillus discolor]KAG2103373.1 hypothetical protein F5147DRAFT_705617 [Suillus discolor]
MIFMLAAARLLARCGKCLNGFLSATHVDRSYILLLFLAGGECLDIPCIEILIFHGHSYCVFSCTAQNEARTSLYGVDSDTHTFNLWLGHNRAK